MKVKVMELYGYQSYNDDYCEHLVKEGVTDWEEVTVVEFEILKKYVEMQRGCGKRLMLVVESEFKPQKMIADYLQKAKEIEDQRDERERRRQELQMDKVRRRQEKQEAKEKAKLQELKAKYEGNK